MLCCALQELGSLNNVLCITPFSIFSNKYKLFKVDFGIEIVAKKSVEAIFPSFCSKNTNYINDVQVINDSGNWIGEMSIWAMKIHCLAK